MKRLTTALKWFAYGITLGVLFAPRSGQQTRQQIISSVSNYLSGALRQGSQTVQQAAGQASSKMDQASYQVQETGQSGAPYSGGPA